MSERSFTCPQALFLFPAIYGAFGKEGMIRALIMVVKMTR